MTNDASLGKDLIATFPTYDLLSLNRLRCDTVSERLGVWLVPDGIHTKIMAELKESDIEWKSKSYTG